MDFRIRPRLHAGSRRMTAGLSGAALLLALALGAAHAQDYPTQRITVLVGFAAGGPVDVIARIIAEGLQKRWKEPVVVENRAGAGGNLAAAAVAKANPDGHTLLFTATGVVINQSLYENPGYSIKELAPISIAATNSLLFAVNPGNPAKSFAEFAAAHRSRSFNPAIAEKLNGTVNEILDLPEVKARLDVLGFVANRQSLPDTVKRVDGELENWRRMVSAIGLKVK